MTRKYSSTSVETALSVAISSSATTMTVTAGTGASLMGGITLTAGNVDQFTLAIDPDTVNEEIVFATQISTDTITIVRGRSGTSAVSHAAGAKIKHVLTSSDLDSFESTTNSAVTLTGTQTLTNKNLTSGTNTFPTTLATLTGTQTLTNKTIDYNSNTILNLPSSSTSFDITLNAQTGTTYTLVSGDLNKLVTLSNASAITLTIPSGVFTTGQQVHIQQLGAGQVTIAGNGTSTFTGTGTKLRAQYSAASIICTGTNTFTVLGDLA